MPIIKSNGLRGRFANSFLVLACKRTNGKIRRVVNKSLKKDIAKGGTSLSDTVLINIAAKETETTEINNAIYGLLFIV
jgi:hypothetical protein